MSRMVVDARIDAKTLKAANINSATYLATDYLNHYNEVAMLVGMLGDMPEMCDLIIEWQPISYADHFRQTGFSDKELAIAAFEQAPADVLARFRAACNEVEEAIYEVQRQLRAAPEKAARVAVYGQEIFELISLVGGVINGEGEQTIDDGAQADVDALFA